MLTQIIGGTRVEYKAVRFVDEFDGEQNGKTLKELLTVLTSKDADKRSDYKDLLENFLDIRLLVLEHIWTQAPDGETGAGHFVAGPQASGRTLGGGRRAGDGDPRRRDHLPQ